MSTASRFAIFAVYLSGGFFALLTQKGNFCGLQSYKNKRIMNAKRQKLQNSETENIIRDFNDRFREGDTSIPGQYFITRGIQDIIDEKKLPASSVENLVQEYDDFNEDNDPHREHDFGFFNFHGQKCFWKIDQYDKKYQYGSEDPTDLSKTARVLTIMLAREY